MCTKYVCCWVLTIVDMGHLNYEFLADPEMGNEPLGGARVTNSSKLKPSRSEPNLQKAIYEQSNSK